MCVCVCVCVCVLFSPEAFLFKGMTVHLSYFFIGFCVISPTHFSNGVIDAVVLVSKSPFWLLSWPHWHFIHTEEAKGELLFYRQNVCKVEGAQLWVRWLIISIFWYENIKYIQYFCQNCVVKLKPHIWLCSVTSILTGSRKEQDGRGAGGHSSSGTEPSWDFGCMGVALTHHCSVCFCSRESKTEQSHPGKDAKAPVKEHS